MDSREFLIKTITDVYENLLVKEHSTKTVDGAFILPIKKLSKVATTESPHPMNEGDERTLEMPESDDESGLTH